MYEGGQSLGLGGPSYGHACGFATPPPVPALPPPVPALPPPVPALPPPVPVAAPPPVPPAPAPPHPAANRTATTATLSQRKMFMLLETPSFASVGHRCRSMLGTLWAPARPILRLRRVGCV